MIVYLIGFRGCGKSVLGKLLAKELNWDFTDLDKAIVDKAGISIPEIFSRFGEAHFRKLESEALEAISGMDKHVVATGGGVVLDEKNNRIMKNSGICVHMTADVETIYRRIKGDENRPPLTSVPLDEEIKIMLAKRLPVYQSLADITIDTSKASVQETADRLINAVKNRL